MWVVGPYGNCSLGMSFSAKSFPCISQEEILELPVYQQNRRKGVFLKGRLRSFHVLKSTTGEKER